jgi:hypothetical protein
MISEARRACDCGRKRIRQYQQAMASEILAVLFKQWIKNLRDARPTDKPAALLNIDRAPNPQTMWVYFR